MNYESNLNDELFSKVRTLDIEEVDHLVLDRISELIDNHLDGITQNTIIH